MQLVLEKISFVAFSCVFKVVTHMKIVFSLNYINNATLKKKIIQICNLKLEKKLVFEGLANIVFIRSHVSKK